MEEGLTNQGPSASAYNIQPQTLGGGDLAARTLPCGWHLGRGQFQADSLPTISTSVFLQIPTGNQPMPSDEVSTSAYEFSFFFVSSFILLST